ECRHPLRDREPPRLTSVMSRSLRGFLSLSGNGRLTGDRETRPALACRGFLRCGLGGYGRYWVVVLELAQPGAELLQASLEVVNLATGNAGAPLRRPPKPVFEGGIGVAQYG